MPARGRGSGLNQWQGIFLMNGRVYFCGPRPLLPAVSILSDVWLSRSSSRDKYFLLVRRDGLRCERGLIPAQIIFLFASVPLILEEYPLFMGNHFLFLFPPFISLGGEAVTLRLSFYYFGLIIRIRRGFWPKRSKKVEKWSSTPSFEEILITV